MSSTSHKAILLLVLSFIFVWESTTVEYRTYTSYGNNLERPYETVPGAVNIREPITSYIDGIGEPINTLPEPRVISNTLFGGTPVSDPTLLNDLHVFFAQFVCHDFLEGRVNNSEPDYMTVPTGDPWFDPFSEGDKTLSFYRIMYSNNSGVTTPREIINFITAFVDGSNIYGSDNYTANLLRNQTHPEFLRYALSDNGEVILPTNDFGLVMDNNAGVYPTDTLFAAGDRRANENPLLTVFHTLFLREHNRLAQIFRNQNPTWDSETVFQEARRWNIAYEQAIVFGEYVPSTIGKPLPSWKAYNSSINPQSTNFFASAGFRYGHSETNAVQQRVDKNGNLLEPLLVRDSYFNPYPIRRDGIDSLIRGGVLQVQQKVDTVYVDDIRNLLFGFPGLGGNDLASTNMNRGRDKGIPLYNDMRELFGLQRYQNFSQVTNNTDVASKLTQLYGSPDYCDPYVCGLAEDHEGSSPVGPLFALSIEDHYIKLRDGDRFYFENADAGFNSSEIQAIKQTTLSDIILRNSNITSFPCSSFYVSSVGDCSTGNSSASNTNSSASFLGGDIVINWNISSDVITFTITAKTTGWVGFGLARDAGSMINADANIGYVSGTTVAMDDYDITDRQQGCPGVCPDTSQGGTRDVYAISGTENNGVTVITWSRKLDTGDSHDVAIVNGKSNNVIYAMADNGGDTISYHGGDKGAGEINFFTGEASTTAIATDNGPNNRLIIHGVFMFFAWAVLFPLGIFVVRFCKRILLKWWFRLHMLIQYLAVLFIIVALILAVEAVAKGGVYQHIHSAHAILGVISVSLAIITPALGQITSLLWANTRKSVPFFPDRVHFIIGYLSPIVGYVTIFFGLQRKGVEWWWYLLVALWLAFVAASFIILLIVQYIYEYFRKKKNRKAAAEVNNNPAPEEDDDEDWDDE